MLFSGGSTSKPKKDEKKDKKSDRDEKYELQEQVFIRWANSLLGTERLSDYRSLADASNAIFVIQKIIGQPVDLVGNAGEDWPNILQFVADAKTNPSEVADGQQKAILSAWWQLIQFYWKHRAPAQLKDEKLSEAIKQWCIEVTKSYEDADVYDFTSSFRDGHAFNYLIHSYDKKVINLAKTAEMSAIERIEHAFSVAEKELKVPRLLMPKDLHSEHLDSHSVLCYLMSLYLAMISYSGASIDEDSNGGQQFQQKIKLQSQPSTSQSLQVVSTPPTTSQQPILERGKSFEQSVESEVRSRKSSSSSQKSSKTKKARREEQLAEFKACIEQVLTWLLEAEDELASLTAQQRFDLAAVRSQFSDFEIFMSSLTDSQDTVGRVLLRGQMLSNKSENDEEKEAIGAKLHLVNTRWEALREQAMHEQATLQSQINQLQQKELENVSQWLTSTELEIESFGPLASDSEIACRQIELHHKFQQKINDFQATIDKLESFVAVVDEENDATVANLEEALASVSKRWMKICEWAEKRATKLDGLADLIDRNTMVYLNLSEWLTDRENELVTFKSAHHLEDEAHVAQHVHLLQRAEAALETEHSSFVKLSQLTCELVARLDESNPSAANDLRQSLDSITQRWDNLVAKIEEYGKVLVQSGKADLKQLNQAICVDQPTTSSKSREEVVSEGISTDTEGDEAKNQLVDKFLMHISKLSHELVPLQNWSENFSVSRRPDQVKMMMNTCQEKLIEIKEQEARVNRLQLELEHLHVAKLNSKQLKRANDAFENFAKGWARIVTKISEAMNVLTGHAHDGEEAQVAAKIEQWIEAVDKVITELSNLPINERISRVEKLETQLKVQEKNVGFIEKDLVKKAILKKGLDIAGKRLTTLKFNATISDADADANANETEKQSTDLDRHVTFSEHPTSSLLNAENAEIDGGEDAIKTDEELIVELDGKWSKVGNLETIENDLIRATNAVEIARARKLSNYVVEKAETRKAEMEEKKRVTLAAKQRMDIALKTIMEIDKSIDKISKLNENDDDETMTSINNEIVTKLEQISQQLASSVSQRKEAERTAEKMLSNDDDIDDEIIEKTRKSVNELGTKWQQVELKIDERLRKAKKDQEMFIEKRLKEGEEALNDIKSSIEQKKESIDAEAAAEHLDNLENSLDKITSVVTEIGKLPMNDESKQKLDKLMTSQNEIATKANEMVAALNRTVSVCEDFEKNAMEFQKWSFTIGFLLAARRSSDISAFDIPHEFDEDHKNDSELIPRLTREFEEWEGKLEEMKRLKSEREDSGRMNEQLNHAEETMKELKKKFNEFKRPKGFEEKLEKVVNILSNVEIGLDDTTGIEGSECGGALMEVRSLIRTLDGCMESLSELTTTRQQLINDKILDADSGRETLRRLEFAKLKAKELFERGSTCLERLEDCVEMYQRLQVEAEQISQFLDSMEKRLDQFASASRNEKEEEEEDDERVVNELMSEWNRNEASMNNAAHLQRQLNERAIKLNDDVFLLKRIRADALKNRLNSWCRTIHEMGEDDETALLEIDDLHQTIQQGLDEVTEKDPKMIAEKLRFLRADRDRLSSRARKLAAKNPHLAATSSEVLSNLNKKWIDLEQKSKLNEPNAPPELRERKIDASATFDQKVDQLCEQYENIEQFLNFDESPISNVEEYQTRIDDLDLYFDEYRPILDEIIDEGRKIAQTGRLELQTHQAIERLDELTNRIENVENELDKHREKVAPLIEQKDQLMKDVESLILVLDVFADRNLDDLTIAQSTRKELAERDAHISSLTSRATAIHCGLPGKGSQFHDSSLDRLRNKIEKLEFRLQKSLEKSKAAETPKIVEKSPQKSSPDRTSKSSMALAMEAYGTATEDDSIVSENVVLNEPPVEDDEKCESSAVIQLTNNPVTSSIDDSLTLSLKERRIILPESREENQKIAEISTSEMIEAKPNAESIQRIVHEIPVDVYEETANISSGDELLQNSPKNSDDVDVATIFEILDEIEDSNTNFEEFPFDYLENAENLTKTTLQKLEECEKNLLKNEMTINVMQSESARERIQMLRHSTQQRNEKLPKLFEEWQILQKLTNQADQLVEDVERFENDGLPEMNRKTAPIVLGELRRKIAIAEGPVIELVKKLSQIVPRMQEDSPKSQDVRRRVYDIEDRFRKVSRAETEAVSKAISSALNEEELNKELEKINHWCHNLEKETSLRINSLDEKGLEKLRSTLDQFQAERVEKNDEMAQLEMAKNMVAAQLKGEAHHQLRRYFSDTSKRLAVARDDISEARHWVLTSIEASKQFWKDVENLDELMKDVTRRAAQIRTAVIYTPSKENVQSVLGDVEQIKKSIIDIKKRVQTANLPPAMKLTGKNAKRIVQVLTEAARTIANCDDIPSYLHDEMSESGCDTTESRSTIIEMTSSHTKQSSSSSTSSSTATTSTSTKKSENNSEEHTIHEEEEEDDDDEAADGEEDEAEEGENHKYSRESSSTIPTPTIYNSLTSTEGGGSGGSGGGGSGLDQVAIQLTHTRHWLHDVERDASATVDLSKWQPTKELWQTIQGIIDEIRLRSVHVTGAHDATPNRQVRQQAKQLLIEMHRTIEACERRCLCLNQLSDESRSNENHRNEMEKWLNDANAMIDERKAEELSEEAVRNELDRLDRIVGMLDEKKRQMSEINSEANQIVDTYTKDDAHNLSHLLSRLNMSWTKFNDNIRIRRAVLEASLRSRRDFHSALEEFEQWLERQEAHCEQLAKETSNTQAIKDTTKRKQWTQGFKTLNAELNAHEPVMNSVESMGKLLVEGLESGNEKSDLQKRISETTNRWGNVKRVTNEIGQRLEQAEQEWEKLSDGLADLLAWIEGKKKKLFDEQPIGGSLSTVMQQSAFIKMLQREIELKTPLFKKTIADSHSFLMQHDLRPKLHSPQILDNSENEDVSNLEQRRRGLEINANCEKLKKTWEELEAEVENWEKMVQHAMQRLQELERNLAECQLHLTSSENEVETMKAVEKIHLEDLKIAREETDQISRRIDEVRLFVDDVNDAAARLFAEDLKLDEHSKGQIENVNKRYSTLKRLIRVRQAAVRNAATDFGPTSEHFLNQSVNLPWQRAISKSNLLPYYIEQTTEKTQWEHPVWVEILKELSQFNRVKFIAYRTAMKLRALQKRLCLDLVDLPILEKAFVRLKGLSSEECPGLEGMVCALLPMFEALHAKHPQHVQSVSLAVDICINFLLNLFDQSREGIMRVLSFKIALIVFSNISLDEKFKYLFKLISQDGHATQKQVALLLYDLIHIPRLVGESAAFGGSNVEPSVRSCFETVRLAPTISEGAFLDWVKKEPQSIVWLAVMHRMVQSENTKHASKCNVCKMFPIVGLRYRCLSCFNLDLCQNCFFSQRIAKRHKLKHPMQEYSGKTTSSDDARDFAKMLKNKLKTGRRPLAYLPIDVADEGVPLTCPPAKITNPATEALNADTAQMTAHLAKLSQQNGGGVGDNAHVEAVQSPLQIINQVEQMQRDETDQLLHRLQVENHQLRRELELKRTATSTIDLSRATKRINHDRRSESRTRGGTLPLKNGRSVLSLKSTQSQNDIMDEAKALRLHKQRLEHRSRILEQQNEQLEVQLQRLKKVIDAQKQQASTSSMNRGPNDVWTPSTTERVGRAESHGGGFEIGSDHITSPITIGSSIPILNGNNDINNTDDESSGQQRGSSVGQMHNLMSACDDLGRAMESLVVSVVYDSDENDD